MKKHNIKNMALVIAVASAGLLMAPTVKATLSIGCASGTYFSGSVNDNNFANNVAAACGGSSQVGSCVFQDNNGSRGGLLANSYTCSGLNTINYQGGDYAQASCFIVQCQYGYYVCNLGGQCVNQNVNCDYSHCYGGNPAECFFYGNCKHPTSSVPEPATVVAGLCLLAPLGIQLIRQFRRRPASETAAV